MCLDSTIEELVVFLADDYSGELRLDPGTASKLIHVSSILIILVATDPQYEVQFKVRRSGSRAEDSPYFKVLDIDRCVARLCD